MTVPNVKSARNARGSDDVERTCTHLRALMKSAWRDVARGLRWLRAHRKVQAVIVGTTAYVWASNRWPLVTSLATALVLIVGWKMRPGEWVRMRWWLRGDTKYDVYIDELFKGAGASHPPKVKRDAKGRAEVWIGERSWRFELLSPQGAGKSARAMCAMWPQLKNEVGHGCIRVNLHERTGNHVTMLIVWSREAGERAVAIDAETLIIVRPTRRWPDLAYNVGLDGWVLARFEHAREWDGTVPHGVVPTVIDVLGSDRDLDEDEPDEELEDEPGEWVEGEPDGDDDDWDDDPYEEPEPEATWAGFPQVSDPHVDSDDPGGGERGGATPPAVGLTDAPPPATSPADPFTAPPVGRPVSAGLFAPAPTKPIQAPPEAPAVPAFRPPGAGFGTMSGDLWDLVERGVGWSTRELADAVGMAVGSAGNALARWRRMGLVACDEGRWLVTQSSRATLPADDEEAVAADGA